MSLTDAILPLYNPYAGCDYHRIYLPMQNMGYSFTTKTVEQLNAVRLVVFNRVPNRLDLVKASVSRGTKLVMDLDDYWELYPEHPMNFWWSKKGMPEKTKALLKEVDIVTCTTARLADRIKPINPNVHVIPNAIPFQGQFLPKERDYTHTGVRFGYVGGSSHLADIKRIAGVFNHFPTLDFTLFGYHPLPANYPGKNVWDLIQNVCNFGGHNPNYKRVDSKPLESYMDHYDAIDVAIAPLKDAVFNTHKSSLKFYEAGAKKLVFIGSDMPPYSDDVPRNIAFLCKNNKEWVDAIKVLRKDPNLVKELGEQSYEWVKENRNMDKVNEYRRQLYESLIQ